MQKKILSPDNAIFKDYLKLLDGRLAADAGLALVMGTKFVNETLSLFPQLAQTLIASEDHSMDAEQNAIPKTILAPSLFSKLDCFGTRSPILLVRAERPETCRVIDASPSVVIPFQNPDNLGAALRSCAAFGMSQIYLTQESAHPFHVKSIRAAGPGIFKCRFKRFGPLKTCEVSSELRPLVFDAGGSSIQSWQPQNKDVLIFGVEGPGVHGINTNYDRLSIPMESGVESLNAAQTLSMALFFRYLALHP